MSLLGITAAFMRDATYNEFEDLAEAAAAFPMDEETFRSFYQRTSQPLWRYLAHASGDPALAEDLLQESFCRFLLNGCTSSMSEDHQKNYLFRIATNLLRDHWRRAKGDPLPITDHEHAIASGERTAERVIERQDLARALDRLKPRERQMLWLAYVLGSSHQEIAETLGLKAASIRLLLFRARRKLADLLRDRGTAHTGWGAEESRRVKS